MTDEFMDTRDSSDFLDDLVSEDSEPAPHPPKKSGKGLKRSKFQGFLGMTPVQTFIISAMFFFIVCLLGFFFMMFTGKMVVTF